MEKEKVMGKEEEKVMGKEEEKVMGKEEEKVMGKEEEKVMGKEKVTLKVVISTDTFSCFNIIISCKINLY